MQFHSPANKLKMGSAVPLTDADRWDWLIALRDAAVKALQYSDAIMITCSSLRRRYRDVFRVVSYNYPNMQPHFIYLKVDEKDLRTRVAGRVGHYMKESMVRSQMECLEEPAVDEFDVIKVDVQRDQARVCKEALARVREKLNGNKPDTR